MLNFRPIHTIASSFALAWLCITGPQAMGQEKPLFVGEEDFFQVINAAAPLMQDVKNCAEKMGGVGITSCGSGMNGVPPAIVGQTKGYLGSLIVTSSGIITATANAKIPETPTYILTPTVQSQNPLSIEWTVSGTCLVYSLCSENIGRFSQVVAATIPFKQAVEDCAKKIGGLTACGTGMNGVPNGIYGRTDGYLGSLTVTTNGIITSTANKKIEGAPTYILTPTLMLTQDGSISLMWAVSGTCVQQSLCSTEITVPK